MLRRYWVITFTFVISTVVGQGEMVGKTTRTRFSCLEELLMEIIII